MSRERWPSLNHDTRKLSALTHNPLRQLQQSRDVRRRRVAHLEAMYNVQKRVVLLARLQKSPRQATQESLRKSGTRVLQDCARQAGFESCPEV